MNRLLDLSLHGSLVLLIVWLLDEAFAGWMSARGRRWWWITVPISFLVWIPLPVLFFTADLHSVPIWKPWLAAMQMDSLTSGVVARIGWNTIGFLGAIWLFGVVAYLLVVMAQTALALRRWSRERLCTDSALLDLLEDCKQEAGITAPIGLVVSGHDAPAIMGWLRPRILLPRDLLPSLPVSSLRAVLFHELAHFRSLDIPATWLFTLARAVHWFNPAAHLAFVAWARFREEAADEQAIAWMKESSGTTYGEALLHALRQAHGAGPPFGALAIGESINNLKRRITMIKHYKNKSPRFLRAGTILAFLVLGFIMRPIHADDADLKTIAVAAMQPWLTEIDQDKYDQSWKDASDSFQKAITSDKWIAALNSVRTPLGKCLERKLISSLHQTDIPSGTEVLKGDFVIAQFDSSYENLRYAVETVTFEKAADGTWKAAGYYIKPKL